MNEEISQLIPKAIEAIEENLMKEGSTIREVPSEYKGYIASFGPSIIQAGLLPALAFYAKPAEGDKTDRTKVAKAVLKTINNGTNGSLLGKVLGDSSNGQNQAKIEEWEEKIMNAIIALKLAIRTFDTSKSSNT